MQGKEGNAKPMAGEYALGQASLSWVGVIGSFCL